MLLLVGAEGWGSAVAHPTSGVICHAHRLAAWLRLTRCTLLLLLRHPLLRAHVTLRLMQSLSKERHRRGGGAIHPRPRAHVTLPLVPRLLAAHGTWRLMQRPRKEFDRRGGGAIHPRLRARVTLPWVPKLLAAHVTLRLVPHRRLLEHAALLLRHAILPAHTRRRLLEQAARTAPRE